MFKVINQQDWITDRCPFCGKELGQNDIKDLVIEDNNRTLNHTFKICRDCLDNLVDTIQLTDDLVLKDSITVNVENQNYTIEVYESGTVKIFNKDSREYETAKPLLRKIINEKKLDVNLYSSTGSEKNTRRLGRDVVAELKKSLQ